MSFLRQVIFILISLKPLKYRANLSKILLILQQSGQIRGPKRKPGAGRIFKGCPEAYKAETAKMNDAKGGKGSVEATLNGISSAGFPDEDGFSSKYSRIDAISWQRQSEAGRRDKDQEI